MKIKTLRNFSFLVVLTLACACGGGHGHSHEQNATDTTGTQVDKSAKEFTSAYICPMHCKGSGSDQPGKCPVCGMEYVKNKNAKDTHDHDHDHGDQDHEH